MFGLFIKAAATLSVLVSAAAVFLFRIELRIEVISSFFFWKMNVKKRVFSLALPQPQSEVRLARARGCITACNKEPPLLLLLSGLL